MSGSLPCLLLITILSSSMALAQGTSDAMPELEKLEAQETSKSFRDRAASLAEKIHKRGILEEKLIQTQETLLEREGSGRRLTRTESTILFAINHALWTFYWRPRLGDKTAVVEEVLLPIASDPKRSPWLRIFYLTSAWDHVRDFRGERDARFKRIREKLVDQAEEIENSNEPSRDLRAYALKIYGFTETDDKKRRGRILKGCQSSSPETKEVAVFLAGFPKNFDSEIVIEVVKSYGDAIKQSDSKKWRSHRNVLWRMAHFGPKTNVDARALIEHHLMSLDEQSIKDKKALAHVKELQRDLKENREKKD